MAYVTTQMASRVKEILGGDTAQYFKAKLTIYSENFEYDGLTLLSIDFVRNYTQTFTGETVAEVDIPEGDWRVKLQPIRRSLRARLTLTRGTTNKTYTYKVIVLNTDGDEATGTSSSGAETLNVTSMKRLSLQLIDPIASILMGYRTSYTILRGATVMDAIRVTYGEMGHMIGQIDGNVFKGVDMYIPKNGFPDYEVLHLEDNLKLTSLCRYFQYHRNYGIYLSGVSRYYDNGLLYVFPTFLTSRYNDDPMKLTIFSPPTDIIPSADTTFKMKGSELQLVITDPVSIDDNSEINLIEVGNAFNAVNGATLFHNPGKVANGEMTLERKNHDLSSVYYIRSDGVNYINKLNPYITNNFMEHTESVAMSEGRLMDLTWNNSDSTLLYPGMPVEYRYYSEGEVKRSQGVLHWAHSFLSTPSQLTNEKRFVETTKLKVFLGNGLIT